jgi:hypothetical protein
MKIFYALLPAFLLLSAFAQKPDPFADPLIRQVQARHEKGIEGDKQAVIDLENDLEKWTKEQPKNFLLMAYLGSTYTLRSRDSFPGPGKFNYLKSGLKTMDEAVEKDPHGVGPRFIRAVNNINLPAFCNRRDNARSDFQKLLAQIQTPDDGGALNIETRQAIYYYAGLSYKQLKEPAQARNTWQAGKNLAPTSPLANKMQAELSKLKS